MKKTAVALAIGLALVATSAHAGGYVPEVPPAVIIEDTAASNQGILVPVLALLFLLLVH